MKNSGRLLLILSFIWAITLLALGGWWLYLLMSFGERLDELKAALGDQYIALSKEGPNVEKLVLWEGSAFLVILGLLSFTMLFLYLKDQQKTKSLQDFFASLTHELKTPLASIRLQAEVIEGQALESTPRVKELTNRMVEDISNLETQMDKILQLSRLERGGRMSPTTINLEPFLKELLRHHQGQLRISLDAPKDLCPVLADHFALSLVLKNLIENTKNHVGPQSQVQLIFEDEGQWVSLLYRDEGNFKGDQSRLGEMFYKYASTQGTGIGLYLVKKSLKAMGGDLMILSANPFALKLRFLKDQEGNRL